MVCVRVHATEFLEEKRLKLKNSWRKLPLICLYQGNVYLSWYGAHLASHWSVKTREENPFVLVPGLSGTNEPMYQFNWYKCMSRKMSCM